MGLLPARMQIADEGMTLGAKVERKAMPSVAEKQKYAHSAFEMNDHQPDGTVKPTMLVSFSKMVDDLWVGIDAMAEHCAKSVEQENPLFATFCTDLDKRAGIDDKVSVKHVVNLTKEKCLKAQESIKDILWGRGEANDTATGLSLLIQANRQREDAMRRRAEECFADPILREMRIMDKSMLKTPAPLNIWRDDLLAQKMEEATLMPWKIWAPCTPK